MQQLTSQVYNFRNLQSMNTKLLQTQTIVVFYTRVEVNKLTFRNS